MIGLTGVGSIDALGVGASDSAVRLTRNGGIYANFSFRDRACSGARLAEHRRGPEHEIDGAWQGNHPAEAGDAKEDRAREDCGGAAPAQRPCAGYLWWGCVGWDPDPNVRATMVRDMADLD